MNTRLIWITPDAEKLIGYIARVSNPENQDNPKILGLLKYLITNKHWSPFEMASMCVEIETSRAIAAQILRHRSFSFQEFSQRYANVNKMGFEPIELRRQSESNRQSSNEVFDPEIDHPYHNYKLEASEFIDDLFDQSQRLYNQLIDAGVAKECARMILPSSIRTRMYMSGTIRSWIHYLELRCDEHAQKEHRQVAEGIRSIFIKQLPQISEALGWNI